MRAIAPPVDLPVDVWQSYHMQMALKRTTVYLDENDLRDLKIAAARRGVSEAEIIREGVQQALLRHRVWDEPVGLPIASSGDPTFASRTDEALRSMGSEPSAE
ncbi:Ribbon-helix-helix protein, copG family [Promicromonospora umidemergens]|uniref:Ribbon-helix-helix protein CopG domain-containing protein n=1 Tax=Promicromonospora umidemergens TaxID=629679 RepID=A0ABP8WSG9_9MICO|nr:CopG family transcriptional regulator [Promicromonospora umidemergens]MCP2283257.1 Ribbon-helix-helix protein, copG family [Promicromonospora umidemergens]